MVLDSSLTELLWGLWNGATAFIVVAVHLFDSHPEWTVYNGAGGQHPTKLYDAGYVLGAASVGLALLKIKNVLF